MWGSVGEVRREYGGVEKCFEVWGEVKGNVVRGVEKWREVWRVWGEMWDSVSSERGKCVGVWGEM